MLVRKPLRPRGLCAGLCGAVLAAAPPARGFSPGRAVEPAPAIYASGPTRTGRTWEMILPSVPQVDYLCRLAQGGLPEGARPGFYYWGCYHPKLDAVILVDPKAWPSQSEWRQARAHEWAHARGWRHLPNGQGTDWARSLPPPGATPMELAKSTASR
jgi:hypothetical protein